MAHFILSYGYADLDARAKHREDHLAHLHRLHDAGQLVAAGPLADTSGGVIVLQADDEAAAWALVDQDPFTRNDVTKDRTLKEWKVTVGSLAG